MKPFLKKYWRWILAGGIVLFLFLRYGGTTVVVLNRAYQPICGVFVSTTPDERGPNRIRVQINSPQSRDIHLPFFMNRFTPRAERAWYVWATGCEGRDIDWGSFIGQPQATVFFEVNRR